MPPYHYQTQVIFSPRKPTPDVGVYLNLLHLTGAIYLILSPHLDHLSQSWHPSRQRVPSAERYQHQASLSPSVTMATSDRVISIYLPFLSPTLCWCCSTHSGVGAEPARQVLPLASGTMWTDQGQSLNGRAGGGVRKKAQRSRIE